MAGVAHRYFGGLVHRAEPPLAVSRKPRAISDALVYKLYGSTEEKVRIVEEAQK